jgi:hypothetical protein
MRIAIGFFGVVSGLLGNSGTRSAGQEICLQKMFEPCIGICSDFISKYSL